LAFLACAEEVAVALGLGGVDRHRVVADGAVQQAFEVVVVFAFAGATHGPRREELLDGVERVVVNQRLVAAVVFDALVGDFADIGGVVQHRGDAVE
jgi:hypothetical protein